MNLNDWSKINGFSQREFNSAGLEEKKWDMHPELMGVMVRYRQKIDCPVLITPEGGFCVAGHSERSLHKPIIKNDYMQFAQPNGVVYWRGLLGRACDHHTKGKLSPVQMAVEMYHVIQDAGLEDFVGLGVYPHNGFIHTDWRKGVEDRTPAVWWRGADGEYHFHAPSEFYAMVEDIGGESGVEDQAVQEVADDVPEQAQQETDEQDDAGVQ